MIDPVFLYPWEWCDLAKAGGAMSDMSTTYTREWEGLVFVGMFLIKKPTSDYPDLAQTS